jgi:hypothetical protein
MLVPPEIRLEAVGGAIVVNTPTDKAVIPLEDSLEILLSTSPAAEAAIESVMESVLSQLQEILTVEYRRPWPAVAGAGSSTFAPPYVEVKDGMLVFGFATRDQTIATVSIPLTELDSQGG